MNKIPHHPLPSTNLKALNVSILVNTFWKQLKSQKRQLVVIYPPTVAHFPHSIKVPKPIFGNLHFTASIILIESNPVINNISSKTEINSKTEKIVAKVKLKNINFERELKMERNNLESINQNIKNGKMCQPYQKSIEEIIRRFFLFDFSLWLEIRLAYKIIYI